VTDRQTDRQTDTQTFFFGRQFLVVVA